MSCKQMLKHLLTTLNILQLSEIFDSLKMKKYNKLAVILLTLGTKFIVL